MSALPTTDDDIRTEGVPYFDPEQYLINVVKRATANGQNILVKAPDLGHLVILSSRGEYFGDTEDLAAFCRVPAETFEVTILSDDDERVPHKNQFGRNLDELMWHAGFHASEGRLLEGSYRDDVVELAHWPNLSRLPMTPNTIRLCALFISHPTSILLAGRLLRVENEEIYQFYSAARCAGLARTLNRKPEEPDLKPYRDPTLLSKLVSRIAGL